MQFFFSPVIGVLSDRFGRRPVLLLSYLGLGLDYIVMALSPTIGWLLVGRLISGITTSTVPTALAYIADVTPKEKRAGAFGLIGAAFGLGFILGPVVGGRLATSIRLPFWVAAASVLRTGFTVSCLCRNPCALNIAKNLPWAAQIQSVRSHCCVRIRICGNSRRFSFLRTSRTNVFVDLGALRDLQFRVGPDACIGDSLLSWSAFARRYFWWTHRPNCGVAGRKTHTLYRPVFWRARHGHRRSRAHRHRCTWPPSR